MMLFYPDSIEEKLEMGQIRLLLQEFCSTDIARQRVLKVKPIHGFDQLETYLRQTGEAIDILKQDDKPGIQFEDTEDLLKKLRTKGNYIEPEKFLILSIALRSVYEWSQYLKRHKDDHVELSKLAFGFISSMDLINEINSKIDEKGEVRSNATPELAEIRAEILNSERKVRKSLQSILEKARKDNYTDEDTEMTIREGRLVIPIRSEFKRQIPGFVHDESSTGQTVFMEPTAVLELNNKVRELRYRERREIHRILLKLSDDIREQWDDIEKGLNFLVLMDFILAKAQFALKNEAIVPKLVKGARMNIINGYHPLLKRKNKAQNKPTVPLNILLNPEENRIVVISGPNAGGKSIALKTVGLLQYMLQCGLPVTMSEESEVGLFRNIFIDIGDSQSLENDLSTYSSRLTAMKYFLEFADKKTLVLIDEFGTGTEPLFGGALAEEMLKNLGQLNAFGVITTHYGNIKELAEKSPGMVNAAMKFNTEKLQPLFTLEVGKPGSSFAFEIARKIGLKPELIENARKHLGTSHANYDEMLTKLESDKARYEKKNRQVEKQEKELVTLKKDYEQIKAMLESDRQKIIKEAKNEARQILSQANKTVEKTIREIQESKAEKKRTKVAREAISRLDKNLKEQDRNEKPGDSKNQSFKVGDRVRVAGQDGTGEIIDIKKKEAQVSFGALTSFISFDRLEPVNKPVEQPRRNRRIGGLDVTSKLVEFKSELDIRGKRAEEVIPILDNFINDALITGRTELRILHGKGHGVLREIVRNHLNSDPHVMGLSDEHADRGGDGVTLATMK